MNAISFSISRLIGLGSVAVGAAFRSEMALNPIAEAYYVEALHRRFLGLLLLLLHDD